MVDQDLIDLISLSLGEEPNGIVNLNYLHTLLHEIVRRLADFESVHQLILNQLPSIGNFPSDTEIKEYGAGYGESGDFDFPGKRNLDKMDTYQDKEERGSEPVLGYQADSQSGAADISGNIQKVPSLQKSYPPPIKYNGDNSKGGGKFMRSNGVGPSKAVVGFFEGSEDDDDKLRSGDNSRGDGRFNGPGDYSGRSGDDTGHAVDDTGRAVDDTRHAGNDTRRAGDDTRRAGDDTRHAGDDTRRAGNDSRREVDDTRRSGDDFRHADGDSRRTDDDSRHSGNDSRRTGVDSRHSGNDSRRTGVDSRHSGDDTRCAGDDSRQAGDASRQTDDDSRRAVDVSRSADDDSRVDVDEIKGYGGSGNDDSELKGDDNESKHSDGDSRHSGSDSKHSGGDSRRSGGDSRRSGSDSRHNGGDSRRSGGDSRHSGGDSKRSGRDSRHSGGDSRRSGGDSRRSGGDFRSDGDDSKDGGVSKDDDDSVDVRNGSGDFKNVGIPNLITKYRKGIPPVFKSTLRRRRSSYSTPPRTNLGIAVTHANILDRQLRDIELRLSVVESVPSMMERMASDSKSTPVSDIWNFSNIDSRLQATENNMAKVMGIGISG